MLHQSPRCGEEEAGPLVELERDVTHGGPPSNDVVPVYWSEFQLTTPRGLGLQEQARRPGADVQTCRLQVGCISRETPQQLLV